MGLNKFNDLLNGTVMTNFSSLTQIKLEMNGDCFVLKGPMQLLTGCKKKFKKIKL